MPETLEKFMKIKYNKGSDWEKLKDDYQWAKHRIKAIVDGDLTPLSDIKNYLKVKDEAHKKLIGIKLTNGLEVKSISYHFIDRVIGSIEQRRSGVEIDDIVETLTKSKEIKKAYRESYRIYGSNTLVSISKDGNLIQTNPRKR